MSILLVIGLGVAAYLVGSIPFGFLAGKVFAGVDIRKTGSGNIGATNVARLFGGAKGVAVFLTVFVLDVGKGVAGAYALALTARSLTNWGDPLGLLGIIYGILAILGHVFPVTLGFKGGKAVATSCGVMLALAPAETLVAVGLWVLVAATTRYVSLASITAAAGLLLARLSVAERPFERTHLPLTAMVALVAALVVVRHRANIGRLIAGTERRLGRRRPA